MPSNCEDALGVRSTSEHSQERDIPSGFSQEEALDILETALGYARRRNYTGYDYADGMSSRLREAYPGDNRWINLVIQESAKRCPINIRPLLGIPKRRNFKGSALFASAAVGAYASGGDERYLREARRLIDWLVEHRRDEPYGWGHNHQLQLLDRQIPRNTPDIVATTYISRAIMELTRYEDVEEYAVIGERVPAFIQNELLTEEDGGHRIRYEPTAPWGTYVLNANALGGSLLVELADEFNRPDLVPLGESLLDYVAEHQHMLGGWVYTDPPDASHLSMDNHHNGFIIESYLRYRARTGSSRYDDVLSSGLQFYRDVLFDANGAPRWDEHHRYPRDIHGAAQGIVTFALAGDHQFAARILGWTLESMYHDGRFYYRKGRLHTRRITLMRWCQAWMTYALSRYVLQNGDAATLQWSTSERQTAPHNGWSGFPVSN